MILALETAYDVCGAALVAESGVLALEEQVVPRQHNEHLAPMVQRLMTTRGLNFADLEGIAVSTGPGSYTGLRVGMSYAKGLAYASDRPIIPVPTLPTLLEGEEVVPPLWVAAWSHRDRLFAVQLAGEGNWGAVQALAWKDFRRRASGQTVVGHRLARSWEADIPGTAGRKLEVVECCPSAAKVGKFALRLRLAPVTDIANLIPDYYHDFQPTPRRGSANRVNHVHS